MQLRSQHSGISKTHFPNFGLSEYPRYSSQSRRSIRRPVLLLLLLLTLAA